MLAEEEINKHKQLAVDSAHMSYFVFPKNTNTYKKCNNGFITDISKGIYNCYFVKNKSGRVVRSGLKKTKLYEDEELLGTIKIEKDDHELQIIDPGYTYRNLVMADVPLGLYMKFWGFHENHFKSYLEQRNHDITSAFNAYRVEIDDKQNMEKIIKQYHEANPGKIVMTTFEEKNMFYDNLLELSHQMIKFEDINENIYRGFVTTTGWGDGFYDLMVNKDGYEVVFIDDYEDELLE